jgi:hypothetical protein
MRVRRGADENSIDIGRVQNFVRAPDIGAKRVRQGARGFRQRVGDSNKLGIRPCGSIAAMDLPDPARAQKSDPDHHSPPFPPRFKSRLFEISI